MVDWAKPFKWVGGKAKNTLIIGGALAAAAVVLGGMREKGERFDPDMQPDPDLGNDDDGVPLSRATAAMPYYVPQGPQGAGNGGADLITGGTRGPGRLLGMEPVEGPLAKRVLAERSGSPIAMAASAQPKLMDVDGRQVQDLGAVAGAAAITG